MGVGHGVLGYACRSAGTRDRRREPGQGLAHGVDRRCQRLDLGIGELVVRLEASLERPVRGEQRVQLVEPRLERLDQFGVSRRGNDLQHLERLLRPVDVGLEVPQVGVRPDLLLAGDLARRDLVEELLGAVGDLERGERELRRVDLVDELLRVRDEVLRGCRSLARRQRHVRGPAVGLGRRRPQVLLDEVPAAPCVALGEVGLSGVEQRVEVPERLGDGLDALPVDPGSGVLVAGRLVVAGRVGLGERAGAGDEVGGVLANVGDVRCLGVAELLRRGARGRCGAAGAGHAERRPDPVADHARLARRDIGARGGLHHEVAGDPGPDVLDLADDPDAVRAEQVELGDLVARVLHLERDRPRGCRAR